MADLDRLEDLSEFDDHTHYDNSLPTYPMIVGKMWEAKSIVEPVMNSQDFHAWFNDEIPELFSLRSEYFLEDLKALSEDPSVERRDVIIKWLEEAYLAGYARHTRES